MAMLNMASTVHTLQATPGNVSNAFEISFFSKSSKAANLQLDFSGITYE
jgi:hypothetical protein